MSSAKVSAKATRGIKVKQYIPLSSRLKAWWLGQENVEIYARFGDRSGFRGWVNEWRGAILVGGCVVTVLLGRANNRLAEEVFENIEMNRMKYYKRDFVPEYAPHATKGIYDGPMGYQYRDESTGIMVNADNKLVAPPRDEIRRNLRESQPEVSEKMLEDARRIRDAHLTLSQK